MNDLQLLREVGASLDLANPDPPARVRNRFLAQARAGVRPARPTLRRLVLAGGLAAVVTAGVLVAQVVSFGDKAPASKASAAEILNGAAAEAKHRPAIDVRGDQFI